MLGIRCSVPSLLRSSILASSLLVAASASDAPFWWTASGVVATNAVPNDYAVVNQGQAKWMVVQAAAELDRLLPGGSGPAISNMLAGFTAGANDVPLNLGQLKFLAAPFYDRIRAEGFTNALPPGLTGGYPWTDAPSDDNDFAVANIGQLKWVFSFDLDMCFDTDDDGLPDGIELRWGLDIANSADAVAPSTHLWAHGLTNLQVFQNRSVLRADNYSSAYDGIPDWWKTQYGYEVDDVFVDTSDDDHDGWSGLHEYKQGSNPKRFDLLTLEYESREAVLWKGGFQEFQPSEPPKIKMYTKQVEQWSDWVVPPFAGSSPVGAGAETSMYCTITRTYSTERSGQGTSLGVPSISNSILRSGFVSIETSCEGCEWQGGGSWETNEIGELEWVGGPSELICPGHLGTQHVEVALSHEFTTQLLLTLLDADIPSFSDAYEREPVDFWGWWFETDPLYWRPAAWFDVSRNELIAWAGRIQYKFWLDSAPQHRFVSWIEAFTPEDDPVTPVDESATPEYTFRHWPNETHPDTGQDETPVYTIDPLAVPEPRQGTNRIVVLPRVSLVPDWNHDRAIADADNQAVPMNPFRFWINDDNDGGDENSGDGDLPGHYIVTSDRCPPRNDEDDSVNGRGDLEDFFPVWPDLAALMTALPSGGEVTLRLRQADNAVRVVYTDLTRGTAGAFLTTDGTSYGPTLDSPSHEAPSVLVTAGGIDVPAEFVSRLRANTAKGIFMVEGVARTTQPLVLEVRYNGDPVGVAMLPLSIDVIAKMYRWINLRKVAGGGEKDKTNADQVPANYPDELCNSKHLIFVHGYNVDEDAARAAASEVFKRLYQSGSRAKFSAVTWHGDRIGGVLPAAAYYHLDVVNAFATAPAFVTAVMQLQGERHILAHSMGNILVASAIRDHGLAPARVYMLDAACAMEAFDPAVQHIAEMTPPDWVGYTNTLLASNWWDLFPSGDGRRGLTWRNRFGDIPQVVNYYSTGEEVLKNNDPPGPVALPTIEEYLEGFFTGVWVYQEHMKGSWQPAVLWNTTSQGGWGFNREYQTPKMPFIETGSKEWKPLPPSVANALLPDHLMRKSFFKPFERGDLYHPTAGSAVATDPAVRAKVLAEAIPALSRATGANALPGHFAASVNMMTTMKNGWPAGRIANRVKKENWLHGDFRDVAFFFVHPLYNDICTRGGLR